ncbi:hypothetical protein CMUST_15200 [Corynebacterium mustelae]|uniref:Uncharacterized protein n=1 Tax=Corynebacterium mustelae TaxID=571915 RepID=A0A0G3H1N9_9CORY|nr:hypothetical protein [Corynebacterium mustelae]AKK07329.1 hypothetical protein CMUST_15200 [Corynebacterium mustelae]
MLLHTHNDTAIAGGGPVKTRSFTATIRSLFRSFKTGEFTEADQAEHIESFHGLFENDRFWVLRHLPEDTDTWLEEAIAREILNGGHPGRLEGEVAEMADRCFRAIGNGGTAARASMIRLWDNDSRLDFYRKEITEYRPRIAEISKTEPI